MRPYHPEKECPSLTNHRPSREKEVLHAKFSSAAAALTDLFRESTDAYEAGYRDALLYVHRYVLLTSVNHPQSGECSLVCSDGSGADDAGAVGVPRQDPALPERTQGEEAGSASPWSSAPTLSSRSVVSSSKLLRFIHNTVHRRQERVALERGTAEGPGRPPHSTELPDRDRGGERRPSESTPPSTAPSAPPPAPKPTDGEGSREEEREPDGAENRGRPEDSREMVLYTPGLCQRRERHRLLAQLRDREEDDDTDWDLSAPPRQQQRCYTPVAPHRAL